MRRAFVCSLVWLAVPAGSLVARDYRIECDAYRVGVTNNGSGPVDNDFLHPRDWGSVGATRGFNFPNQSSHQLGGIWLKMKFAGDTFALDCTGGGAFPEVWRKNDGSQLIFRGGAIDPGDRYWMHVPKTTDTGTRNRFTGQLYDSAQPPQVPNDGTWVQLTSTAQSVRLNPPWLTYYNQIKSSLGADCRIRVGDFDELSGGDYRVDVTANSRLLAKALAIVTRAAADFGGVTVHVRVFDAQGNQYPAKVPASGEHLQWACRVALRCNPYYCRSVSDQAMGKSYEILFLRAAVIQYYNDDLSDYYGNANETAQAVFREVLTTDWDEPGFQGRILVTTVRIDRH